MIIQDGAPLLSLGPWGTILLTLLATILAIIGWRQRTWKSTADAAVAEMNVHKEAAVRLRQECKELKDTAAELARQTNLQPLSVALNSLSASIATYFTEGRARFIEATKQLDINTTALRALVEEVKAQRITSEESYRSLTAAFIAHTIEDKENQLEATRTRLRFVAALEALEARLKISENAAVK